MIPRRSPDGRPGSPALVVRPNGGPSFAPATPPGGWTPRAALEAAVAYADAHAEPDTRQRTSKAAYAAILAQLPEVKRAEIIDRLRGRDILAEHFAQFSEHTAPLAEPDDDLAPY
jgi:hypothetical protein